jgi:hypothetical protein
MTFLPYPSEAAG